MFLKLAKFELFNINKKKNFAYFFLLTSFYIIHFFKNTVVHVNLFYILVFIVKKLLSLIKLLINVHIVRTAFKCNYLFKSTELNCNRELYLHHCLIVFYIGSSNICKIILYELLILFYLLFLFLDFIISLFKND